MRETGNWWVCTSQWWSCQWTYTTAWACGASPTSQVVWSYGNWQMPGPYEGMLCRSFSTQATCNQWRLTHWCSRWTTTIVNNSCSWLSQSQCGIGQYGSCNWNAWASIQTRTVTCKDSNGNTVSDSLCPQPKPTISQPCNTTTYSRQISSRSACTNNTQNRTVTCKDSNGNTVSDSLCPQPKPITSQSVSCPWINGTCKTFTSPVYTNCNTIPSWQICNTYAWFSYQPATNTSNGCLAGQYNDISDDTYRKRQCVWSNGWTTATCNADFEELISTQCDSYSEYIWAC